MGPIAAAEPICRGVRCSDQHVSKRCRFTVVTIWQSKLSKAEHNESVPHGDEPFPRQSYNPSTCHQWMGLTFTVMFGFDF